ncbi:peptidoglycan binding domain-containing protein, partial [Finegoldia magna]|uniref:peptidoglycan binding domain-containing protein n=1 Tax=Finegoldia magna TaxID=1260 RepID=UPI0018C56BAD
MKKRVIITTILFLFLVYFSATTFFTFYALPNTYVNGYNMSFVEKSKIVDRNADIRSLTIGATDNRKLVIDAKEVDFNLKIPEDFKFEQNPFSWPLSFFDTKKYNINFDYTIDEDKLNKKIYQAKLNKNAKKSYNAYISYLDDEYTIIPEEVGNEINTDKLKDTIKKSLLEQKEDITLKNEYIKPTVYANDWNIIRAKNKLNKLKDIEISFDFNDTIHKLKGAKLRDMMDFDDRRGFVYKD